MKPNLYLFLILITSFVAGCAPINNVSKKTISHNYSNISFSPESIQKMGKGNIEITVIPINAATINRETFEAASRDGNYEKELASAIEKSKSKFEGLKKSEKIYINGKIHGIDAINKLEKDNLIPSNTAYQLKKRIWYGENYGKDGTEVTSLSGVDTYADIFNPYKINQKYLSVFKITFENKGNEIEKISLKQFQVVSGEELLYPLGIIYFENNLKDEPEKVKNIYRMNMPEELILTPTQRITKFIAIPAINSRNENLQIQIIKEKEIINFEFKVKEQNVNKDYEVESYDIVTSGLDNSDFYDLYYAVSYKNGISFATKDARVYVSEDKKTIPVSIYIVAIDQTYQNAIIAQKINFRFIEEMENKVIVQFK
jgi:hypothetical protein